MSLPALALSFRIGLRKGRNAPIHALGSVCIFLALVASYGQMLNALPEGELARMGVTHGQLVWYIILTEITLVGTGPRFRETQDEVQAGAMEIMLLRPASFWPIKVAGWTGEQIVRVSLMLPVALGAGWVQAGWLPLGGALPALMLSWGVGVTLIHCSYLMCGVACLWVGEGRPIYFLYQKLVFLLGGLLWPLVFYPTWLWHLAWFTPFPAMIATPGDYALAPGAAVLIRHMMDQLAWLAVFMGLCMLAERAIRHRIAARGQA